MTPERPRAPWGWNGPARGLLILVAGSMAGSLAWSSRPGPGVEPFRPLVVDANTAPAAVLGALPGLGPVLAGRIVEARGVAPFRSLDDFDRRVKGIGPAKVSALRPFLRFDPRPTSPP